MSSRGRRFRASSTTALLCSAMMVLPPEMVVRSAPAVQQASPAPGQQPTPAAAPKQNPTTAPRTATTVTAATATAPDPDGGWPRVYTIAGGGTATLFQPQIAAWANQQQLVAWSAISYARPTVKDPALGTIKIEAQTKVSPDTRLVNFNDFKITESNFPSLSRDDVQAVVAGLQQGIPTEERVIALDRVLANIDKSAIGVPKDTDGIKADPPPIFTSQASAILVNLDGDAVWSPIQDVDLKFAVNTNWDLFQAPNNALYLRNGANWLTATDLQGPWSPAAKLPASFTKLPANDNWKETKANIPGKAVAASAMPRVFVSTTPAELLLLAGPPQYQSVPNTSLLWVSNTESDVFRLGKTGAFYYLVSGRWFSAASLAGPWTFATPTLPEDFKRIPLEHPRSRVLASVPGTDEAIEAVLLAQMPRSARVNVKETKAPDVVYQGDPKFEPITGTMLARAVNTDKDIIKVGDLYYMCFQAVWFMSTTATGPWQVATSVPKEIYTVPVSSPVHHVTYVTIEEDNDDDWVTFAYVAGYTGMMVGWGCAMWGSGYYYPPYVWYGGGYPGYYGYGRTYGASAWYNPWTGGYGRGGAVYGPYGGAGAGAVYNPRTGTYARGAAAYGPYGGRAAGQAYNPRTGTYGQTRQGSNIYGNWGSTSVQRGDDWARTSHVTNNRTGATTRTLSGDGGGSAISRSGAAGRTTVGRTGSGDIYAGRDGNVYRQGGDGGWQSYNGSGWDSAARPTPTTTDRGQGVGTSGRDQSGVTGQLNRDSSARTTGAERTRDYGSYQRTPTTGRAGSYRGGGASRGGGGRRR
jgi:hypothetical protein